MVPGSVIAGRFTVVRQIARSPMSLVVEAVDTDGRHVVVKLLETESSSKNAEAYVRFEREGRLVTSLTSRHVVRVFEFGTTPEGRPFLVMELLTGNTLAKELRKRERIPVEEAASYIAETCDALIEAHDAGIIHRDIKPQNLYLTQVGDDAVGGTPGPERILKVLDFGISKLMNPSDQITVTDALFGSPLYMAPETFRAAKLADARSDVWALGVVLYEMVTGISPFAAETPVAVGLKVTREPFVPASWKCPDLPAELDTVIGRSLAKSPDERFQTVRALLRALLPFLPPSHQANARRTGNQAPPTHADDDNPRTLAEMDIPTRVGGSQQGASDGDRPSMDGVPTRVTETDQHDVPTAVRRVSNDEGDITTRVKPGPSAEPPMAPHPAKAAGMTTVMPVVAGASYTPLPSGGPSVPLASSIVSDTGRIDSAVSVTAKPLNAGSSRSRILIVGAVIAAPLFGVIGYVAGHHSDPPTPASSAAATVDPVATKTAAPTPTTPSTSAAVPATAATATASATASPAPTTPTKKQTLPPPTSHPPSGPSRPGGHKFNPLNP